MAKVAQETLPDSVTGRSTAGKSALFYAPIGFVQPAVRALMTAKVGPREQAPYRGSTAA